MRLLTGRLSRPPLQLSSRRWSLLATSLHTCSCTQSINKVTERTPEVLHKHLIKVWMLSVSHSCCIVWSENTHFDRMSAGSQGLIQYWQYSIDIRLCFRLAADGLEMTSHWSSRRGCGHTGRRRTCYKDKEISLRTPWKIIPGSTPHSPELRGGAVTPTGGGASGLWIGGVMGGVPVPKNQWTQRRL